MINKYIATELRRFAAGKFILLSQSAVNVLIDYSDWPRVGMNDNGPDAYTLFLLFVAEAIE